MLIELVTLVLIIFTAIYINYKNVSEMSERTRRYLTLLKQINRLGDRANDSSSKSVIASFSTVSREKQREGFGVEKDVVKEEQTDSTEKLSDSFEFIGAI